VGPEHVPIRNGLFELSAVFAKPLVETTLPIAPPPHSQEVIRRGQNKKNCKQDVVKDSQSAIPHLRGIMEKKGRFSNPISPVAQAPEN